MTDLVLHRASAEDAGRLARLDAVCFDVPWDERSLSSLLSGELTTAWYGQRADAIVAYVLVRIVAGEGEILRMGVEPASRRQHLATALLRGVIADVSPRLPHGLHLEVRAANVAARRLYQRQGFEQTGVRARYYADPPDDAILMRWQPSRADVPAPSA